MIEKHLIEAGTNIGKKISKVDVVDGKSVGCLDTLLIKFNNNKNSHSIIISQNDFDNIIGGRNLDLLETKIEAALQKSL